MNKIQDDILSYREMFDTENVQTLQRGMNFRLNPSYSVILMSQRSNAPYNDRIYEDGVTIEYEGHDVLKRGYDHNPKREDQPDKYPSGKLTQNGRFIKAVNDHKSDKTKPELVKGYFDLVDYKLVHDGNRNVFRFILKLSDGINSSDLINTNLEHTRLIPSEVKREVWKRDGGKCVLCGDIANLHFDHELPFSKGGTSLSAKNVRLLCMKHNLQKSNKIE